VIASDVQTLPHSDAYGGELTRMAKAPHPGNRLLAYELGGQRRPIGSCSSPLPRRVMNHGMAEAKVLRSSRRSGCRVSSSAYNLKPSPRVLPTKRKQDELMQAPSGPATPAIGGHDSHKLTAELISNRCMMDC
jgi:hypothetical protein